MSVFLDTGFFVAFHNTRDINHTRAVELMKSLAEGEFGAAYTSDYVFDEAVTVALVRTGRPESAIAIGRMILGETTEPFLTLLRVGETEFREAWRLFSQHSDRGLSFTDCTTITLTKSRGLDRIISFDSDFNGVKTRIS